MHISDEPAQCIEMLWMKTYCFYCSVRLGVVVSAIYSLVEGIITITLVAIYGLDVLQSAKRFIEQEEHRNQDPLIKQILVGLWERSQSCIIVIDICIGCHLVSCLAAVYGALKLQRYYLIPYMIFQFIKLIGILTQHIVTMVILKKILNLGILIGLTLAGGFYILFNGYCWAGSVAMFQIIVLVNSQKYRAIYGEDPMAPRERNEVLFTHGNVENVKIFLTPNDNEINAIKRKRMIEEQQQQQQTNGRDVMYFRNWHLNELVHVRKGFN